MNLFRRPLNKTGERRPQRAAGFRSPGRLARGDPRGCSNRAVHTFSLVCAHRVIVAIVLGAISLEQIGCAPPREPAGITRQPIMLPATDALPQLWIYGDLSRSLPDFDATPLVERFLYGPNDYGKTALRNPQGMTVVGRRLLICDQGYQRILSIRLDTGKSTFWSEEDRSPRCPVDITHDAGGGVYVADTTSRAVLVYDLAGRYVEDLVPPADALHAFRPCSLYVRADILYVGNLAAGRIERYDLRERRWLVPIRIPAGRGVVAAPTGLAFTADGTLLVADAIQGSLLRLAPDGGWLGPLAGRGRGPGELIRPKQVCCTPDGMVFVSDAGRQSVQVFDAEGKPFVEIHERANEWAGWTMPMGLLTVSEQDLVALELANVREGSVKPDSYVIVSDSLGPESLTLIGVVTGQSRVRADEE